MFIYGFRVRSMTGSVIKPYYKTLFSAELNPLTNYSAHRFLSKNIDQTIEANSVDIKAMGYIALAISL